MSVYIFQLCIMSLFSTVAYLIISVANMLTQMMETIGLFLLKGQNKKKKKNLNRTRSQ